MTVERQEPQPDGGQLPVPTKEQIAAYLAQASHDELKTIPEYNKRFQTVIADARTEAQRIRDEAQQSLQEDQRLAYFERSMMGMSEPQRLQALQNPDYAHAWAQIQERRTGRVDINQIRLDAIIDAMESFKSEFSQEPGFEDFDWSKFENEKSPSKALQHIISHGTAKERASMSSSLDEEIQAKVSEALVARGMARPQPDVLPPSGAGRSMDYNALMQLSPDTREDFRKKNSDEYDAIVNVHLAAREARGLQRLDQVR